MQSKRDSLAETLSNTSVGFLGSLAITWACMRYLNPLYGPAVASMVSVGLCTVWSLLRGYSIRRYFNRRTQQRLLKTSPQQDVPQV